MILMEKVFYYRFTIIFSFGKVLITPPNALNDWFKQIINRRPILHRGITN